MVKKLEGADLAQVQALLPLLEESAAKAQELAAKIVGDNPAAPGLVKPVNNIPTDIDCDECGKPMVVRQGRRGPFLGCSGYPKCHNTAEVPAKLLEDLGMNAAAPTLPPQDEEEVA
jgi:DNA topoisomerase-1